MKALCIFAWILLIIGGLNWGLVGLFDFNLIDKILGYGSVLSRILYILIGLAGLYEIYNYYACKDTCYPK